MLSALVDARAHGWTEGIRGRLEGIADAPAVRAFLGRRESLGIGGFARAGLTIPPCEVEAARLADRLSEWSGLLDRDPALIVEEHLAAAAALRGILADLPDWFRDGDEEPIRLALFPDGGCDGYLSGDLFVIDALGLWLGRTDRDTLVRSARAALFQAVAARRWERSLAVSGATFRTIGERWAAEFLARLVFSGVAARCLLRQPESLGEEARAAWAQAAAEDPRPVETLSGRLSSCRCGSGGRLDVLAEEAIFASGRFSRFRTLGRSLVDLACIRDKTAERDLVADPRLLPELLIDDGVPSGLAAWSEALGRGGWGVPIPVPPRADREGRTLRVPAPGCSFSTIVAGLDRGSHHDPPGLEGLAHLVEHLVAARMVEAGQEAVVVHGYTERDATLFLFALDEANARRLPSLLDAVFRPLAPGAMELARAKSEVCEEIEQYPETVTTRLLRVAEQRLLGPRFGRPVRGGPESVERIRADRCAAFHRRIYRADRAIVASLGRSLAPFAAGSRLLRPRRIRARHPPRRHAPRPFAARGAWLLALGIPELAASEERALGVAIRLWRARANERWGAAVEVDAAPCRAEGLLHLCFGAEARCSAPEVLATLARWLDEAPDARLRSLAERWAAQTEGLGRNPESLGLWLVCEALRSGDAAPDLVQEAQAQASVSPQAVREAGRAVLASPCRTWVDSADLEEDFAVDHLFAMS